MSSSMNPGDARLAGGNSGSTASRVHSRASRRACVVVARIAAALFLLLRPSMAFFSPVNSACAAAPRDVYLDVYLRLFAAAPPVGLSD